MTFIKWPMDLDRRGFLQGAGAAAAALTAAPHALRAAPSKGGTLRVSINRAPNRLNPLLHKLTAEYLLAEMLYSGLTRLNDNMEPQPDLAESWQSNEALTEWTFKLRSGVKYHHGPEVVADDVVATFKAILDKETGSPGRKNVGPIADIVAVDSHTVTFTLTGPFADLPVTLAEHQAKIIPADIVTGDMERLDREGVGSGPFKLASFEADRIAVVERNPDYFVPGLPYLDRVELRVFPDAAAEVNAFLNGEIDVMPEVWPTDFARVEAASGVTALRLPSGRYLDMVLATDQKPFDDPKVREALKLSLDRGALVEVVAEGYGTVGNDTPISSAYRYFSDAPLPPRDTAKAKALLAEAGYPDGIDITLVASVKPPIRQTLAVAVREMAKPAGFNIDVQTMQHGAYLKQVWKKGNFYIGYYNMRATEDGAFQLLYTSDAPWNETRWNNKTFDALVEEARRTVDPAKRGELYGKAQALMQAETPVVIPVFFDVLAAHQNYVKDFSIHQRSTIFGMEKIWLGEGAPQRG